MLTIDQLQTALSKAEEHKRLGRAIRSMYAPGRTFGVLWIGASDESRLTVREDENPEAFAAVVHSIRKRQAVIEAELTAMGISLAEAVPAGA